ncbi:MAG: DNA-binding response regulator, partial [Bacteroidetes bacterium QS_1_65_9]
MSKTKTDAGTRMLIAEDDAEMGVGLEDFFDMQGYDVERVTEGSAAIDKLTSSSRFDIVILDVMMPNKNGFEVLREAREAGVDSPVLMLTVKGQEKDKLQGF